MTDPEHPDRHQPDLAGDDREAITSPSDAAPVRPERGGADSSGEWVTLDIDVYVLEWFRQNTDDANAAINAALREHMERARGSS